MVFHMATGVLLFLSVAIPHPNQDCRLMAEFFDFDAPLPRWAFARGSERLIMDRGATAREIFLLTPPWRREEDRR